MGKAAARASLGDARAAKNGLETALGAGSQAVPAMASRTIQIPVRSCTCVWIRDSSPA